jgi:hypothetical protein
MAGDLSRLYGRACTATIAALLLAYGGFWLDARTGDRTPLDASRVALRLDPNRATLDELTLLPHIGPKIAAHIVETRTASGEGPAFRTLNDLHRVPHIGPAILAELEPYLVFPPAPEAANP